MVRAALTRHFRSRAMAEDKIWWIKKQKVWSLTRLSWLFTIMDHYKKCAFSTKTQNIGVSQLLFVLGTIATHMTVCRPHFSAVPEAMQETETRGLLDGTKENSN